MKLRMGRPFYYGLAFIQVSLAAMACTPQTGEVMLVVQSDMELPKDVDTLRIEISQGGLTAIGGDNQQFAYQYDHEHLGDLKNQKIRLPATIGILAPEENPSSPVTVRVLGKRGGAGGRVRVLNEITTTIPSDRIVSMQLPVQFLCADRIGSSKDCEPGTRCLGGVCVSNTLDSSALPEYSEPEVFGEGSCLSVSKCMEEALLHQAFADMSDGGKCKVNLGHSIDENAPGNIAVLTDYKGMCNNKGCFVALDMNDEAGFRILDPVAGIIQVAQGVCDEELSSMVRGIAEAPVSAECPQKELSVPTCGPWSSVGLGALPSGAVPVSRASGQHRPTGIAHGKVVYSAAPGDEEEFVFWSSAGLFSQTASGPAQSTPGAIHSARIEPYVEPGTPVLPSDKLLDPTPLAADGGFTMRDTVFSGNFLYWTAAKGDQGEKGKIQFAEFGTAGTTIRDFPLNTTAPEGIAAVDATLMWTDFNTGDIMKTSIGMGGVPKAAGAPWISQPAGSHPYRIAVTSTDACWTNEGTPAQANGSVYCCGLSAAVPAVEQIKVMDMLETPRAIAMGGAELYFATFAKEGKLFRATRDPLTNAINAEPIAVNQSYPNGIALDAKYVYWSNWGDGTLYRLARGATPMSAPELLANAQRGPGEIAVLRRSDQQTLVFWLNEGSVLDVSMSDPSGKNKVADGMIMQLVLNSP